mmetsp:Transcript_19962/g.40431  ORF Transcript_19962/g.40431 Transcript_19962/m.40431 type:complete len:181 (-) Transcript_19962:431-973(-)|eukprot:CAMPEP_0183311816 /NCGR_PEP_ID=MMETSP0160_2-20130417/39019_1 /TAXON_ID=2839 ORGANISM="Odontella Sinensis, Strain Grunow 1884" /NCGR_SAMPLE_ID=MMETSP0160_2 /ASSEMBLY_ACC=CAM_ASM_000250 /LENGTH=180 /DNA_ID=CAMNT_0025476523 /DNA_START=53 /DNA_END=595 /DNA_ORIENTATION=+
MHRIREFESSDLGELVAHDRRMTRELIGEHGTAYCEDWLEKLTRPGRQQYLSYHTLVASDANNHAVGFAILHLRKRALRLGKRARGHYVELFFLSVAPECQRGGIGGRLVDASKHWASTQGAAEIRLAVISTNADAIRFYARKGFEEIGLLQNYPEKGVLSHRMRFLCEYHNEQTKNRSI